LYGNEKQKGTTNSNMKSSKVKKEEADSDDDDDFTVAVFMPYCSQAIFL